MHNTKDKSINYYFTYAPSSLATNGWCQYIHFMATFLSKSACMECLVCCEEALASERWASFSSRRLRHSRSNWETGGGVVECEVCVCVHMVKIVLLLMYYIQS